MTKDEKSNTTPTEETPGSSIFNQDSNELLDDISMDLTVEVGRAKIKISELLGLKKGSVVHLDQLADEPLSIYANDKLIAKGHIISSNGKYSIRVI